MAEAECYPRRDQADVVPAAGDNRPSWILQASTHSASLSTSSSLYLCLRLILSSFADDKNFPDKTRPSFANPKERGVIGPASL